MQKFSVPVVVGLVALVLAVLAVWQFAANRVAAPALPQREPAVTVGVGEGEPGRGFDEGIEPHEEVAVDGHKASLRERLAEIMGGPTDAPSALIPALHNAAVAGDLYAVADYVRRGVPLESPGANGLTPFLAAVHNDNAQVAGFLLDAGADISMRDAFGNTAVHLAAQADNVYTLDTLVKRGAKLMVRNDEHYTPLHTAAEAGATGSIRYLHQFALDFITPPEGENVRYPVHLAAENRQWAATETFWLLHYRYYAREAAAFGDIDALRLMYQNDPAIVNEVEEVTGASPLGVAVTLGNDEIIYFLLERGASMYQEYHDYNAMGLAIAKELNYLIPKLIDYGFELGVNNIGLQNDGALHFAIRQNNMGAFETLLEHGANPDQLSGRGLSPLHLCVLENKTKYAMRLFEVGANVNINDSHCIGDICTPPGNTPLHLAVLQEHFDFAKLLLESGADVNSQRRDGQTPLHLAANSPFFEHFVPLLLGYAPNLGLADRDGFTPLHTAARSGRHAVALALLEAGADTAAQDEEGHRPLHVAAAHGNGEIVELLLEHGAELDAKDNMEKTPLYAALEHGQSDTAALLLTKGADTALESREKRSLLFPAAKNDLIEIVDQLLEAGLDINHKDFQGATPLHAAVQYGTQETIKHLMERGAEPNTADRFNQTPLHYAADRGFTTLIRELVLAGGDMLAETRWGHLPIHRCAMNGHWGGIHFFMVAEPTLTIDTPDADGNTPLHHALRSGVPALVEILIERGADILVRNDRGFTPLGAVAQARYATIHPQDDREEELRKRAQYAVMTHYLRAALYDRMKKAIFAGDTDTLVHYLKEEPSLLNVMIQGETPLHLAARTGRSEVVSLLLEQGANPDFVSRTPEPGTALELAQRAGHSEVTDLLSQAG